MAYTAALQPDELIALLRRAYQQVRTGCSATRADVLNEIAEAIGKMECEARPSANTGSPRPSPAPPRPS